MNIEESKKILDKFVTEHKLFNIKHSDGLEEAIETLLTAYEKEKEKNSKLLEALDTVNHEKGVFIESYEKEKEKNKELQELYTSALQDWVKEKEKNKNLEQENSFLKMMYRGTDEFKAIENLAKEE